jgi:hypothetical protein
MGQGSFPSRAMSSISTAASDTFTSNLTQILKSLSRSLLFQPSAFHLWTVLDSFSFTLFKFSSTFPVDAKSLVVGLQEVLLDLAHCYEKNANNLNSSVLAICLSSILHSIRMNDEAFILPKDVRKCLRHLICCPELFHCWPEVYQFFLQFAVPFDDALSSVSERMEMTCKGLEEMFAALRVQEDGEMTQDTVYSIKEAIPHLHMAESQESIESFLKRAFTLCTNPIYQNLLEDTDERLIIVLQLMAHPNDLVRKSEYSLMRGLVKKHFGPEKSPSLAHSTEESIASSIILNKRFLREVIHFGISDKVAEVR